MREVHCDFCYAVLSDHAWDCPARDFDYEEPRTSLAPDAQIVDGSIGSWLACDSCASAVRSGHREVLTARAVARARTVLPPGVKLPEAVLADLRALHDRFWENRMGTPIRIGAEQLALIASDDPTIREPR